MVIIIVYTCIALKEIKAHNRRFPQLSQCEILSKIMHIENVCKDENELNTWILSIISDSERLGNLLKILGKFTRNFEYENNVVIKLL